jgi:hypothetical protein
MLWLEEWVNVRPEKIGGGGGKGSKKKFCIGRRKSPSLPLFLRVKPLSSPYKSKPLPPYPAPSKKHFGKRR